MPPPLPSRVGRYEIIDRLGAGGMGVVYLATDPLLRRTVAIKVLPAGDDELRERFGREARSAASLRHSNVVTIYDVGEHDGQPFIAMEFLDGESMAEMIQRKAQLPVERRLQLIIDLCSGLGHAHRSGIIHRDIKPGNLMITTEGALKVLDFGLARLTAGTSHTGLTRAGSVMGTPHYMSPEQVEGQPVDQRSDIFSVGLVLYELLSYHRAYSGDSAPVVLHNILHKTPTPIRSLMPSIDSELEEIVGKGLEKVPSERYQALATLSADLVRVRTRLIKELDGPTLVRPRPGEIAPADSERDTEPIGQPTPRNFRNMDAVAQRRAAQVELHMAAAARHFAERSYEAAIAECENAIVFNPQEARALDLLDRAHHAIEDVQVDRWLGEAKVLLDSGEFTAAEALIEESLKLRADSADARALQREVKEKRRERERLAERLRAAMSAIERAQAHLDEGALDAAVRCASEALGYDPGNVEAIALKDRALAAIADRRREQEHDRAARDVAETARLRADAGDASGALFELRAFAPPHELVTLTIAELETRPRGQPLPEAASTRMASFHPQELVASAPPELKLQAKEPERPKVVARERPVVKPAEHATPSRRPLTLVAILSVAIVVIGTAVWRLSLPSAPSAIETPAVVEPPQSTAPSRLNASPVPPTQPRTLDSPQPPGVTAPQRSVPTSPQSETTNSPTEAVSSVKPSAPTSAFASRLREASRSFENGDYASAISLYRAILAADPGNSEATAGLKTVTRAQETERQAIEGGTKAVVLTADQARQLARLLSQGQQQQADGEYASAISSYEAALRIDPKNAGAANALAETRKAQAAEAAALKALVKKPGA